MLIPYVNVLRVPFFMLIPYVNVLRVPFFMLIPYVNVLRVPSFCISRRTTPLLEVVAEIFNASPINLLW